MSTTEELAVMRARRRAVDRECNRLVREVAVLRARVDWMVDTLGPAGLVAWEKARERWPSNDE